MKETTSKQPRKQRKWKANAPLHKRHKMMSATLSKELRQKYKRRSMPVRKKDIVKVMRGNMTGHSGEVLKVDIKAYKIYVHGITSKKTDGKEVERPIAPSNVMLIELSDEDKERREILNKKMEAK